jgi:hypothetical protein
MLVHNYCYLVKLNSHAHIQLSHPICNHNPKIFSKGNFLFYFKLIHKYCDNPCVRHRACQYLKYKCITPDQTHLRVIGP